MHKTRRKTVALDEKNMSGTLALFSFAFTNVGIDSIFSVVPSLVGCAVICFYDPSCASIFYHQETHKCYLSSTVYRQTSPSLVPVSGMRHYHSDRCPPGSTLMTSEAVCVTVFPTKVTQSEADALCRSNSFAGHNYRLLTFRTKSKHDELIQCLDKVLDVAAIWTGLTNETESRKWTWKDGSEAVYLPWAPNEPSNPDQEYCSVLYKFNRWTLHDNFCYFLWSAGCEVSTNT